MPKPIVVVGSINLDMVAAAEQLPARGATVFGNAFNTFFGGKGANQAVAAAKLGYPVIMIGNVGTDVFGGELIDGLRGASVDVGCVERVEGASGVAVITIDKRGENTIVVVPGANASVTPAHVEKHRDILAGAGMILTQLEIPLETTNWLGEFAAENGIPLVLDPAPVQVLPESLLKSLAWITPNETEARLSLSGGAGPTTDAETAQSLLNAGVRNVILKLGVRGAMVAQREAAMTIVPAYKVSAVDTTAAGDAFNGAFAVATMRGLKAVEAAQFANAVAAISVTRHGAQPSMPTGAEVEQFLKQ